MTVFITILLAVLTFAVIAYPLLKQKVRAAVDSGENENLLKLQSQRDTTYSMLKELEFDFQSGILSEDDYQDLETRYKRKAIAILRDIDDSKKGTNVEEEIERQVRELRREKDRFCPQCGAKCQENARFCSGCGTSLNEGEPVD